MKSLRNVLSLIVVVCLCSTALSAQTPVATPENTAVTAETFVSDNCTWFPDGNYKDCCVQHDREYFNGGSWKERWRSDKKLYKCVASKPKFYNKIVAPFMWLGVRAFGVPWLGTKASWGFGKKINKVKKPKK
jgi:hypothetical protein